MQNNIILVRTGHILEKSVKEVEEVIDREEPDVVAVELCEGRYKALKGDVGDFSIKEVMSSGSPFLILTHWLLAYVQRKMGAELGGCIYHALSILKYHSPARWNTTERFLR